jgi:hypothetical protein
MQQIDAEPLALVALPVPGPKDRIMLVNAFTIYSQFTRQMVKAMSFA